MSYMIRKAEKEDLPRIYEIYETARQFMRENGNHAQWGAGDRPEELLEDDISQGAIASTRAAKIFGLDVLEESINFERSNYTRFIIVTNQKVFLSNANKISLSFEIKHQAGALYNMLSNFYYNDLNLTKIESRPIENRNWEYQFFVDIEGNLNDPGVRNALACIRECAKELTILGNVRTK